MAVFFFFMVHNCLAKTISCHYHALSDRILLFFCFPNARFFDR